MLLFSVTPEVPKVGSFTVQAAVQRKFIHTRIDGDTAHLSNSPSSLLDKPYKPTLLFLYIKSVYQVTNEHYKVAPIFKISSRNSIVFCRHIGWS